MGDLRIEIAGVCTEILTRDPGVEGIVRERYEAFLSRGAPDWRIEIEPRPVPGWSPADSGVVVTRDGSRPEVAVERADVAGSLDVSRRCGRLVLTDPDDVSIDCVLRIAYSLAVLDSPGLMLHAASLVRNGKAYLFCGRSGTGKTTVARLSSDATLLSDELSIVSVDDSARCHGTPFWGELARAGEDRAAALQGVYFLHHGRRHAVDVVKPATALQRLLPNVLFFVREAELTARVLHIAGDLVENVRCFDLRFRPDPGFWEVIDGG